MAGITNSERKGKTFERTFTTFRRIYAQRVGQTVKHLQSTRTHSIWKQI